MFRVKQDLYISMPNLDGPNLVRKLPNFPSYLNFTRDRIFRRERNARASPRIYIYEQKYADIVPLSRDAAEKNSCHWSAVCTAHVADKLPRSWTLNFKKTVSPPHLYTPSRPGTKS